jgi:hypothetical protein
MGNSRTAARPEGGVVSREFALELRVGGFLRGAGGQSLVENSAATFHTAIPRGPSPIFVIRPSFWSLRMARCAWVLEIPALWAKSRSGRTTSPEGEADRAKAPNTLEAEGGRERRIEGKWVSVSPGWYLTISLRRATLALAIATPCGRGDAGAPCHDTGPFFYLPSSPSFTGSAPGVTTVTLVPIYSLGMGVYKIKMSTLLFRCNRSLSALRKTCFPSVVRAGYRRFSMVAQNFEKQ